MTEAPAIRVDGLVKHYRTGSGVVRAVDGVSLAIDRGSSLALMGPSGCGKSTLLGLIGGLETPTEGRVMLGDTEISALSDPARARIRREQIGLLFQSDNLLAFLTATENVALQLSIRGLEDEEDRSRQLLVTLGLEAEVDKLPDQLSGGQRQRVGIARALVHRPAVILADEPTGELDAATSQVVIDRLLAAQRELGATLVVVTHDPEVAGRLDRTLRLRDGHLVEAPAGSDDATG